MEAHRKERMLISTCISGIALLALIVHSIWPGLLVQIDNVSAAFIVLAFLPWLAPIIKSIEVAGQKIEFQDTEARGAAESAVRKAEAAFDAVTDAAKKTGLAVALSPVHPEGSEATDKAQAEMDKLVENYNQIRATQPRGDLRTRRMTSVVRQMIELAPQLRNFPIGQALKEATDRGKRLAGYAYLYSVPEYQRLDELIDSVTQIEDKPFGQYWGIQAIGRILEMKGSSDVSATAIQGLRHFHESLEHGTDRHYELRRILRAFRT